MNYPYDFLIGADLYLQCLSECYFIKYIAYCFVIYLVIYLNNVIF